jgi:RNA polymerase sigma-70 factor, ECF subfamily
MQEETLKDQEAVLRLCAEGDNHAWSRLVEFFAPLVYRAIRQKASPGFVSIGSNDIEDIFQQTFANIWRRKSLNKITNARSIPAYITAIAQNTALDFLRHKTRQQRLQEKCADDSLSLDEKNPRKESHDRQLQDAVGRLIAGLPEKEQKVIRLEVFYGLKHREIAYMMDMPVNTISTIIARIKKSFKEKLKQAGYEI